MDLEGPSPNGRIYPRHVIEAAMKKANWSAPVLMGADAAININVEKIAGMATDIAIVNNQIECNIKLFETECGKVANALIDSGSDFYFRPSGVGTLKKTADKGSYVVGDDYQLLAVHLYDGDPNDPS